MRIAIVEDEGAVARRLERALRSILGERIEELTIERTLASARERVADRTLDLVFLDLNLNGRDGFELLSDAAAASFQTIVVSAHEEQAIRAFEYGVADFVAKPWTEERLRVAVERALGRETLTPARRVAVRHAGSLELIDLSRVLAIGGADDYAELHLENGEKRLHEKTLVMLERLLPPSFARVHRSWIVNFDHVRRWMPTSGGRGTLEVAELQIPVGRTYRRLVADRFEHEEDHP
jgi:DNA-binding LytR/AlgR family response regulator